MIFTKQTQFLASTYAQAQSPKALISEAKATGSTLGYQGHFTAQPENLILAVGATLAVALGGCKTRPYNTLRHLTIFLTLQPLCYFYP
jgi:hypothetical protein